MNAIQEHNATTIPMQLDDFCLEVALVLRRLLNLAPLANQEESSSNTGNKSQKA